MPLIRLDQDIVGYEMTASSMAYEWGHAGALLLLGIQAVRIAWASVRQRPTMRLRMAMLRTLRLAARVARTGRPVSELAWQALDVELVPQGWTVDRSPLELVVGACSRLLYAATPFVMGGRQPENDLGYDALCDYVREVVRCAAFAVRDNPEALHSLELMEVRCLIHLWTDRLSVAPMDLVTQLAARLGHLTLDAMRGEVVLRWTRD